MGTQMNNRKSGLCQGSLLRLEVSGKGAQELVGPVLSIDRNLLRRCDLRVARSAALCDIAASTRGAGNVVVICIDRFGPF